jgi:hypothetical protein
MAVSAEENVTPRNSPLQRVTTLALTGRIGRYNLGIPARPGIAGEVAGKVGELAEWLKAAVC